MKHFSDKDISTEYSALMSKVMHNGGRIKFPVNEPAEGKKDHKSQEYKKAPSHSTQVASRMARIQENRSKHREKRNA